MNNKEMLSFVNTSGFLLQTSVADRIEKTKDRHGWEILAEEYPHFDPYGRPGFTDAIVGNGKVRLVVEVKKYSSDDGQVMWVFLVPEAQQPVRSTNIAWLNQQRGEGTDKFHHGIDAFPVQPESYASNYCVIAGQEKNRPMLERVCIGLVQAIDSLMYDELVFKVSQVDAFADLLRFYVPVVVTNVAEPAIAV